MNGCRTRSQSVYSGAGLTEANRLQAWQASAGAEGAYREPACCLPACLLKPPHPPQPALHLHPPPQQLHQHQRCLPACLHRCWLTTMASNVFLFQLRPSRSLRGTQHVTPSHFFISPGLLALLSSASSSLSWVCFCASPRCLGGVIPLG